LDYSRLDPQQVLASLDAVGLRGDGRVLQLNSYENRVFQVFLEDGQAVVAKFYRPGRWSDAQIVEEHQFALELAAAEVPWCRPWCCKPSRTQRVCSCWVNRPRWRCTTHPTARTGSPWPSAVQAASPSWKHLQR
jgi:hypothetical protein